MNSDLDCCRLWRWLSIQHPPAASRPSRCGFPCLVCLRFLNDLSEGGKNCQDGSSRSKEVMNVVLMLEQNLFSLAALGRA